MSRSTFWRLNPLALVIFWSSVVFLVACESPSEPLLSTAEEIVSEGYPQDISQCRAQPELRWCQIMCERHSTLPWCVR